MSIPYKAPKGRGGGCFFTVETGGLFEREDVFNLAKMIVSVVHKELKYKVEKPKYKKSEVVQPRIKNKSELLVTKFYSHD